jgi:hypothetical protein
VQHAGYLPAKLTKSLLMVYRTGSPGHKRTLPVDARLQGVRFSRSLLPAFDEVRNFLRPTSYINQTVSLAHRRTIHVQRVAALRDLISAA